MLSTPRNRTPSGLAAALNGNLSPPKTVITPLSKQTTSLAAVLSDLIEPSNKSADDAPAPPAPPMPPMDPASRSARSRRSKKRIKTLAWVPLPDNKLTSTFWSKTATEMTELQSMVDNDFEELFAVKPALARSKFLFWVTLP